MYPKQKITDETFCKRRVAIKFIPQIAISAMKIVTTKDVLLVLRATTKIPYPIMFSVPHALNTPQQQAMVQQVSLTVVSMM